MKFESLIIIDLLFFVSPNFMILGGLGGIVVSSLYPSQLEAAVQEEAEEVARMID